MAKKYLSLERLTEYDELIKSTISSGDAGVKSYVDTELSKKANSSHSHAISDITSLETTLNGKVPTSRTINGKALNANITLSASDVGADASGSASAVQTKLDTHTSNSDIHVTTTNKSNWNSAYTHSTSAHAPSNAQANVIEGIKVNGTSLTPSSKVVSITIPTTASDIGAATSGHNHDSKYDAKGAAASALADAQAYADSAASTVKNDLLNGAGTAYDTLKELGDLIDDNKDAIDALEEIASGKANATHTHAISDVSGLQSALDGKAAASHGTHVSFDSTNTPKMDGTAAFGTSSKVARADHVHPTDTSRASQADLDALEAIVDGKADSGHTHNYAGSSSAGGAATSANKVNSSLTVKLNSGTTEGTNMFTFNGSAAKSINITPSAIGAAASSHIHDDRYYTESEVDTKLSGKANSSHTHTAAQIQISNPYDNSEADNLEALIQDFDSAIGTKSDSGHSHSTATTSSAGFMSAAMVTKLNGIATGANKITVDTALSSSSTNPVQNKVVNSAIVTATSAITANTNSITALQEVVEGIQEITSAEIQALFSA